MSLEALSKNLHELVLKPSWAGFENRPGLDFQNSSLGITNVKNLIK